MKNLILLLAFALVTNLSLAQSKTNVSPKFEEPYETGREFESSKRKSFSGSVSTPGQMNRYPQFPGGKEAFINFFKENLKYPQSGRDAKLGGSILLSFVVNKDGHVSDVKILKGLGCGWDEEAIRIMEKSPLWQPGIQNNTPVNVRYSLPIHFVQDGDE
jgi:TonB family protein